MLTEITIRNFKMFGEATVPLGNGFVFVGPNNQGKTSALQALTLWHTGLRKWVEQYGVPEAGKPLPKRAVAVNRLNLVSLPIKESNLIWRNRKVRKAPHDNIRIELIVKGISRDGEEWQCGLEFDYSNREAFFCRPLRTDKKGDKRMPIPPAALDVKVALLPPMSGLTSDEVFVQKGRIDVLMGQGRTAEMLRNVCYNVFLKEDKTDWQQLTAHIKSLFGITLNPPLLSDEQGALIMDYVEKDGKTVLDLPSCGRGMQQTMLLLAFLYDNAENTVFLIDEPDAHLEVFRQREVFNLINDIAEKKNGQVISATHSEELLKAAVENSAAVVFTDKPHILRRDSK